GTYAYVESIVFDTIVVVNDTLYNRHLRTEELETLPTGPPPGPASYSEGTYTGRIYYREEEIILLPQPRFSGETVHSERFTHGSGSLHRRTEVGNYDCTSLGCTTHDARMVDASYRRH